MEKQVTYRQAKKALSEWFGIQNPELDTSKFPMSMSSFNAYLGQYAEELKKQMIAARHDHLPF